MIQPGQDSICSSMDINRVCLHAQASTINGHRFNFVKQNDQRPMCSVLRDSLAEEFVHVPLASSERFACQAVGFNLKKLGVVSFKK